ncbi:MAG: hypothetical protein RIS43_143 [Actinomycetota bacterium]
MTHPLGRVHIVGIGGAGMSALARLLLAQGAQVSGSDAKDSKRLDALNAEGAITFVGHSADYIAEAGVAKVDTVAASTAVPETNAELARAREMGIRVLTRAELLCAITDKYEVASVAGTHGKTTTTSMLTVILQNAGVDPSFAIGSELNETGSNAHLGSGSAFVVEADESDGTFLTLNTKAAIVTNVEPDHLNYWKTFDAIEAAFVQFAVQTHRNDGFAVICIDDQGGRRLADAARKAGADVRTYGQAADADFQVRIVDHSARTWNFTIWHDGVEWVRSQVRVPGVHNVLNGTAAILAAVGLGVEPVLAAGGLTHFTGTRRRFDFKGEADGVRVFDDYAHHPTEIAATLRAARDVAGVGNVVVAFQAHHYYRTALFSKEFGDALGLADFVVVLEVFAPGEEFIPGASGQTLASNVPLAEDCVVFEPSWSEVSRHLVDRAQSGDIIMTLGAGEIGMLCSEIVELLAEREQARGN